jgi:DNA-binding MarR family transcriptional regulator
MRCVLFRTAALHRVPDNDRTPPFLEWGRCRSEGLRPREPNLMQPTESLTFDLLDAGRLYTRRFHERFRDLPLDLTHCRALLVLADNEGITQQRLSALIATDPAVLGRALDRLEACRLVNRRLRPGDRRARSLAITPDARTLLPIVRSMVTELHYEALKGLSRVEGEILSQALARVLTNLSAPVTACEQPDMPAPVPESMPS